MAELQSPQMSKVTNDGLTRYRYRYVGLTSLYMAVMMSDGLDVVTVELELE